MQSSQQKTADETVKKDAKLIVMSENPDATKRILSPGDRP
jgi:hypothetical protein